MKKILLLEDNKLHADLTGREIHKKWADVELLTVSRLAEAKNLIMMDSSIDLAIFDLNLPDGNGLDLLSELRENNYSIPVIILTGSGSEEVAVTALKTGANNYVVKNSNFHKEIPEQIEFTLTHVLKNRKHLSVLYVEHQKSDVDLTTIYLKKHAPHIHLKQVASGEEVLKLLPKNSNSPSKYDLLLLDYRLPGLNALEISKTIRLERKLSIPIVIVTGQGDENTAVEALKIGADEYIVKSANYLMRLPSIITNAYHNRELERKQEALIRSESKYRLLATNTLDTIFTADLDFNITFVNDSIKNLLGYTSEAFLGMNPQNFTTKKGFKTIKNEAKQLFEKYNIDGELSQTRFELPLIKKDATQIITEVQANLLLDTDKKITGFQGRVNDIAERKRAEQIQHVILNISNVAQFSTDLQQTMKLIQTELSTLMDTKNFFIALYNEEKDSFLLPYYKDEKDFVKEFPANNSLTQLVLKGGKSLLLNKEDVKKLVLEEKAHKIGFDSEIWLGVPLKTKRNVTGALVLQSYTNPNAYTESDKEILEIISNQISITIERKLTEERLKNALENAQQSDRLKTAFLANMSHEIRTPMNGILGFSELLKQPNLSSDKQMKFIDVIEKSGVRMLNTLNDIIDISRIESGNVHVSNSKVHLNEQMEDLYAFFFPEASKKGLLFSLNNELNMEDSIINSDSQKIFAILSNLIKNAIKFTEHGFIEIGCTKTENNILFYIKDTGIGIPVDRQPFIFDRFVQADIEDKAVHQGSGLGLSISKAYSEMLNGEIWFKSEEERGSEFYFSIPCNIN